MLGVSLPWNDDGPACDLHAPRAGGTIRIQRQFSAEAGRLVVITILVKPGSLDHGEIFAAKLAALNEPDNACAFLQLDGCLACRDVLEILPDEVTPLFMGQLLDRTTKRIVGVAEAVGIVEKA